MKRQLLVCFLICLAVNTEAQYKQVKQFTTSDGLPSNMVYNCREDNQGFLWVCTPAGVARFDGRFFQNYTKHDSVPDNEVLQVVKENNGRIWISSYRQEAAYFDAIENRFINSKEDTLLGAFSGTGFSMLSALPDGGVRYFSQGRSVIFKDHRRYVYTAPKPFQSLFALQELNDQSILAAATRIELDAQGKKWFGIIFSS